MDNEPKSTCSDISPMPPIECGDVQLGVIYRPDQVIFKYIEENRLYAFFGEIEYELDITDHPQKDELKTLKHGDYIKLNFKA